MLTIWADAPDRMTAECSAVCAPLLRNICAGGMWTENRKVNLTDVSSTYAPLALTGSRWLVLTDLTEQWALVRLRAPVFTLTGFSAARAPQLLSRLSLSVAPPPLSLSLSLSAASFFVGAVGRTVVGRDSPAARLVSFSGVRTTARPS